MRWHFLCANLRPSLRYKYIPLTEDKTERKREREHFSSSRRGQKLNVNSIPRPSPLIRNDPSGYTRHIKEERIRFSVYSSIPRRRRRRVSGFLVSSPALPGPLTNRGSLVRRASERAQIYIRFGIFGLSLSRSLHRERVIIRHKEKLSRERRKLPYRRRIGIPFWK